MTIRKLKKLWNNKRGFKTYSKLNWFEDFSKTLDDYSEHTNQLSDLFKKL